MQGSNEISLLHKLESVKIQYHSREIGKYESEVTNTGNSPISQFYQRHPSFLGMVNINYLTCHIVWVEIPFLELGWLNPRRHSPFRQPSRHKGWYDPPRIWLLSELELRLKNQRIARHETKSLTSEFKVLGQPVTTEVRSMTKKGQNASSPITSYLSKVEPRFKDQNVSYGLRNTMQCLSAPYDRFLGAEIQK